MAHAIEVERVSKRYRLGAIGGGTLREDVHSWWAKLRGRPDPLLKVGQKHAHIEGANLWALRDVSFDVEPGEILGIIGKNGAGKSTLLKILSRITAPSSGEVRISGRTGSLLEVGTGFHPELTGGENIYLNGAILGMSHAEIKRKFDEIVDFSGISTFIDTPVKRYSSGMSVRLAFAVAAHLDPEVLIIDEVLAVGDAGFQKMCLGKMGEVARGGRTVLFVSHNMAAVKALCTKAALIEGGQMVEQGAVSSIVDRYMEASREGSKTELRNRTDRKGNGMARVTAVEVEAADRPGPIGCASRARFTVHYESDAAIRHPRIVVAVYDATGTGIFVLDSATVGGLPDVLPANGTLVCETAPISLTAGRCIADVALFQADVLADNVESATVFDVEADDFFGTGRLPHRGWVVSLIKHEWQVA